MKIGEIKNCIKLVLNAEFPAVTVRFESVCDDEFHIGVSVYGVEAAVVKKVKERILDLDEDLCSGTEFAITPLVRDLDTTAKYYPDYLFPWTSVQSSCAIYSEADVLVVSDLKLDMNFEAVWAFSSEPFCSSAQNEELALAA